MIVAGRKIYEEDGSKNYGVTVSAVGDNKLLHIVKDVDNYKNMSLLLYEELRYTELEHSYNDVVIKSYDDEVVLPFAKRQDAQAFYTWLEREIADHKSTCDRNDRIRRCITNLKDELCLLDDRDGEIKKAFGVCENALKKAIKGGVGR